MSDTQYQAGILAGLTPGALLLCSLCVGNTHVEASTAFHSSNPAFAYFWPPNTIVTHHIWSIRHTVPADRRSVYH